MDTSGQTEKKKNKYFSFGFLSKKMLIPLLIPILYSIRHYALESFDQSLSELDTEEKKQSVFINTFIHSIAYSLNLILFIIENRNSKSRNKKTQEKVYNNQLLIERERMEKKEKTHTIVYLILLSIFNYFNYLFYDIISMFKPSDYNKKYFYILSIPVFFIVTALMSSFLLNYHFHRHQKLTMIISPVFSLTLLIFIKLLKIGKENKSISSILYLIECLGLRSLRYILVVLGKLIMEKKFVTQFKLMAFLGIFGIIFSLIGSLIVNFLSFGFIQNPSLNDYFIIDEEEGKKRLRSLFDSWGYIHFGNIMLLIATIILWFAENNVIWFSIYAFSPNHYTVYASINTIIVLFIDVVIDLFDYHNIIIYIFYTISLLGIFICGLIFNEIILVRLWGLDKNTIVEINKRQKLETEKTVARMNLELSEASYNSDNDSTIDKCTSLSSANSQ